MKFIFFYIHCNCNTVPQVCRCLREEGVKCAGVALMGRRPDALFLIRTGKGMSAVGGSGGSDTSSFALLWGMRKREMRGQLQNELTGRVRRRPGFESHNLGEDLSIGTKLTQRDVVGGRWEIKWTQQSCADLDFTAPWIGSRFGASRRAGEHRAAHGEMAWTCCGAVRGRPGMYPGRCTHQGFAEPSLKGEQGKSSCACTALGRCKPPNAYAGHVVNRAGSGAVFG